MKRVLVTGAAGFLGSHLCKYHLDQGDQVLGIDDFSSSKPSSEHLKLLQSYPRFTLRTMNINSSISSLFWQSHLVYNFACPASPPRYQSMPEHTMLTCVLGTHEVLSYAKRYNAVVVHASTSEIYGDPEQTPQCESYRGCVNSYGPRSCYDEGKRAAEALCWDFLNSKTTPTDVRLARIFNTYGPNMDPNDGRVVSNFIVQALKGEALTIYGTGDQTRSFCYVDDLIRGIVALGELKDNPRTPINIGNPIEFTMTELAMNILSLFGKGSLEYKTLPVDDPTQRCPDITLAREILNWEPKVDLVQGLEKTLEYFRKIV